MLKAAGIAVAILMLIVGPNAFWLARSTVRIENQGAVAVPSVTLTVCSKDIPLGPLAPASAIFRVLPQCGDDTLTVSADSIEVCRMYVEESLYHIRVRVPPDEGSDCTYGEPPFSPLLLMDLL